MKDTYAVVTGASSGLGLEFAKQLSVRGYKLILVGRNTARLEQLQKVLKTESVVIGADLSHLEECQKIVDALDEYEVEVFVNNAGFGDCGRFYETDIAKDVDMIAVNVTAVHVLTKMALRTLRKKVSGGYILNVASSAGIFPAGPYMATYYATKAYVVSLTQSIARELLEEGSDLYIGALCPGPVDTEFNDRAGVEFALKGMNPRDCVRIALDQMFRRRKELIVPTLRMKLAVLGIRLLPREQMIALTAGQQKKKRDL